MMEPLLLNKVVVIFVKKLIFIKMNLYVNHYIVPKNMFPILTEMVEEIINPYQDLDKEKQRVNV